MKTAGIIAEYNPFHNGHAYQIRQVRKETHADFVVVVMSGDFVQRGEPALLDKYVRARMALKNGADLVLELPAAFACAGAEYFARGGVSLLHSLGCIDTLCFGMEQTTLSDFEKACKILTDEPDGYQKILVSYLKKGMGYPAARSAALSDYLQMDVTFLRMPNNILALEYLCALKKLNSSIQPHAIRRIGSGYHSQELDSHFSSATAIRHALLRKLPNPEEHPSRYLDDTSQIHEYMPDTAYHLLEEYLRSYHALCIQDFSSVMQYALLMAPAPEYLTSYFDIDPFLANRIFQHRFAFQDLAGFAELLTSKNQTRGHIQRALFHILLDIRQPEDPLHVLPQYTRILGMKRTSSQILKSIKEHSSIPVLTKLADASKIIQNFPMSEAQKSLAARQLQETTLSTHIYESVLAQKSNQKFRHENTRQFVIL